MTKTFNYVWGLALLALLAFALIYMAPARAAVVPDPVVDAPLKSVGHNASIVLAGGCFWGMQEVFEHVKGVTHVTAGYAGGGAETAQYETVSGGNTGHAESVQITYDPSQVSLGKILQIYFSVAHDPTQLNHQGADTGSQYRSSIFFGTPEQQQIAQGYVTQLIAAKAFGDPIVTKIVPLQGFYPAEEYHQDYAKHNPDDPYILFHDAPKVAALQKTFPQLYVP